MQESRTLPDKIYFSIGEVARYFDVSTSLIRYWEDEFPQITPRKNGKGDRRYTRTDIDKIARIYELIKERKFTIKGAKSFLADNQVKMEPKSVKEKLIEIKTGLLQVKRDLLQMTENQ